MAPRATADTKKVDRNAWRFLHFAISIVLIRMVAVKKDGSEIYYIILWRNQSTSSTWYCRPIEIMLEKKTLTLSAVKWRI